MANPFDQFDAQPAPKQAAASASANPFDAFDGYPSAPVFDQKTEAGYRDWMNRSGQTRDAGQNVDDNFTGSDYDYRGFFQKYGPVDVAKGQHFTDEFKLPNHETFSNESIYAAGPMAAQAGSWDGDNYKPSTQRLPTYMVRKEAPEKPQLPQDRNLDTLIPGRHTSAPATMVAMPDGATASVADYGRKLDQEGQARQHLDSAGQQIMAKSGGTLESVGNLFGALGEVATGLPEAAANWFNDPTRTPAEKTDDIARLVSEGTGAPAYMRLTGQDQNLPESQRRGENYDPMQDLAGLAIGAATFGPGEQGVKGALSNLTFGASDAVAAGGRAAIKGAGRTAERIGGRGPLPMIEGKVISRGPSAQPVGNAAAQPANGLNIQPQPSAIAALPVPTPRVNAAASPPPAAGAALQEPTAFTRGQRDAGKLINKALKRDGLTLDDLRRAQGDLKKLGGGIDETLPELAGKNLQGLARATASIPGAGAESAEQLAKLRRETFGAKTGKALGRATGKDAANLHDDIDAIIKAREEASGPAYEAFYNQPVQKDVFDRGIRPILKSVPGSEARERAAANLALKAQNMEAAGRLDEATAYGNAAQEVAAFNPGDAEATLSPRALDYVKRAFDDMRDDAAKGAAQSGNARHNTGLLTETKNNLAFNLDTATGGKYSDALGAYSGPTRIRDMIDIGLKLPTMKTHEFQSLLRGSTKHGTLTAEEIDGLTTGLNYAFQDSIAQNDRSFVNKFLRNKPLQDKLEAVIGDRKEFLRFRNQLLRHTEGVRYPDRLVQGSPTARIAAEIDDATGDADVGARILSNLEGGRGIKDAAVQAVLKPIWGKVSEIYRLARYRGIGNEEVNAELSKLIFGAKNAKGEFVPNRMTDSRLDEIIELLDPKGTQRNRQYTAAMKPAPTPRAAKGPTSAPGSVPPANGLNPMAKPPGAAPKKNGMLGNFSGANGLGGDLAAGLGSAAVVPMPLDQNGDGKVDGSEVAGNLMARVGAGVVGAGIGRAVRKGRNGLAAVDHLAGPSPNMSDTQLRKDFGLLPDEIADLRAFHGEQPATDVRPAPDKMGLSGFDAMAKPRGFRSGERRPGYGDEIKPRDLVLSYNDGDDLGRMADTFGVEPEGMANFKSMLSQIRASVRAAKDEGQTARLAAAWNVSPDELDKFLTLREPASKGAFHATTERLVDIAERAAKNGQPLTLAQLAERADVPQSSLASRFSNIRNGKNPSGTIPLPAELVDRVRNIPLSKRSGIRPSQAPAQMGFGLFGGGKVVSEREALIANGDVILNPSQRDLGRILGGQTMGDRLVRLLRDPDTGKTWAFDGEQWTHHDIINRLGLDAERVHLGKTSMADPSAVMWEDAAGHPVKSLEKTFRGGMAKGREPSEIMLESDAGSDPVGPEIDRRGRSGRLCGAAQTGHRRRHAQSGRGDVYVEDPVRPHGRTVAEGRAWSEGRWIALSRRARKGRLDRRSFRHL